MLHCLEKVISGELYFASQITTNIIISDLTLQVLGNFLWIHHQPYDYIRENESWLSKRFVWPLPWMFLGRIRLIINCFLLEEERLFNPYLVSGEQSWWKKWLQKTLLKQQRFYNWKHFQKNYRCSSAGEFKFVQSRVSATSLHTINMLFIA